MQQHHLMEPLQQAAHHIMYGASWNQGIYGTIQDFTFSYDGSKMYILLTDYMLYENILTTPWEINTSYWSGKTYDLSTKLPYNIQITDDGTKMHIHSAFLYYQ